MAKKREQMLVCHCKVQFMQDGVKHEVSGWLCDVKMGNWLDLISAPKYLIVVDANGVAVGLREYRNYGFGDGFYDVFVCEEPISVPENNKILPLNSFRVERLDSEGETHVYINTNYC